MKLSKIREIFEAYQIMVDPTMEQSRIAASRLEICNSCPFMKKTNLGVAVVKVCGECGCVLAAKSFSQNKEACPKNKWDE